MNPGFQGLLHVEELPNGREAELLYPLSYFSPRLDRTITIPPGFISDYASDPFRAVRDRGNRAAWLHDYLYAMQFTWCDRKNADHVFYEAMRSLGVGRFEACKFFLAVRMFGWKPWNEHRDHPSPFVINQRKLERAA